MEYSPEIDKILEKYYNKKSKLAKAKNRLKRYFSGKEIKLTDVDRKVLSEIEIKDTE